MVTAKKHAGFSVSASLPTLLPMGKERSNNRGFTLLELMLVCLLVMVLATLAIPMYNMGVDRAKNSRARSEIRTIEGAVNAYVADRGVIPPDLATVGYGNLNDPWHHPYQFGPSGTRTFVVPINSDYDLFSMGPDGLTDTSLMSDESDDDIIRAQAGRFVGPAIEYGSL